MKHCFLQIRLFQITLLVIAISTVHINAQERKSVTMPWKDGTLTFQYYERGGMKIPDGTMEFTKGVYSEKGECKDGYREGLWIAKKEDKLSSKIIEYNYKKGLLEGQTSIKLITTDKTLLRNHEPNEMYSFHNGRLFGENRIVNLSDTIYCNFGENGKRIGTWKIVNPEKVITLEYNDNPDLNVAYEIDILGNKKEISFNIAEIKLLSPIINFNDRFRIVMISLYDRFRPELPTLCENKFGYLSSWVNMNKNEE